MKNFKKTEFYFSKVFLSFVFLMLVPQVLFAASKPIGTVNLEEIDPHPFGTCTSGDGLSYDMEDVRHYSNKSIKMSVKGSDFILTVDFELIVAVEIGNKDNLESIFNIENYASEGERPDVLVNFAELNHEEFIYWRESFVNRTYRHGLFKFDGDDLETVCSGLGGATIIR